MATADEKGAAERVGPAAGPAAGDATTQVAACPPGPFSRDHVGEVIGGRYRLLRLLGAGGMGTVYLAEHVHLGRLTAVKLLLPALCAEARAEERFRREALLASRINHQAVAHVYDFDIAPDGGFFLAMEYVDGESLAQRLRRAGPLAVAEAHRILAASAAGLDYAHALRIVHRDIKPANLMLSTAGDVKILDFGVARPLDLSTSLSVPGLVVGTPAYMSPEQLMGHEVGPAADIYALGLVVYEMLTGKVPHMGGDLAEVRARRSGELPPPLHRVRRECPPLLSETVARALAPDPEARWPSATAFAEAAAAAATRTGAVAVTLPSERAETDAVGPWEKHFDALRLAGREREVRTVQAACAAALMGRTSVLWIEGEEGSGKSTFFDLALRESTAGGAVALVGRGFKTEVSRPYGSWFPILREARRRVPDCQVPAVDAVTGPSPGPLPADRAAFYDEVSALMRRVAESQPLLVGIEDLDWCDPASQALFAFLPNDLPKLPVLLAVTVQAESVREHPDLLDLRSRLRALDLVEWLTLKALKRPDVAAWLAAALGREPPDALVDYVYGNSEGNAFFIEQVMRELLERQELEQMTDETVRVSLAEAPPPLAVADVLKRRLRGLGDAERETLQVAAVVGRGFDVDLLIAILERPEDAVLQALDEAVRRGILLPEPCASGDRYRFTHKKIRDVLAQELNTRRRRRLHARIADALEARAGTAPGEAAWHWFQAGETAKAGAPALAAAAQAMAVYDYDDALTYAVMAAQVARTPEERFQAHALRGDALRRLDRPAEASRAYAEARQQGAADPAAVLGIQLKELHEALEAGSVSPADAARQAGALQGGEAALAARERADLWLLQADVSLASGQAAAAECAAIAAFDLAAQHADAAQAGEALLALAGAQMAQANLAGAERSARAAWESSLRLGDSDGAARGQLQLGAVAAAKGDAATARAAMAEALRLAEKARIPRLVRQIQQRLGELDGTLPPPPSDPAKGGS